MTVPSPGDRSVVCAEPAPGQLTREQMRGWGPCRCRKPAGHEPPHDCSHIQWKGTDRG